MPGDFHKNQKPSFHLLRFTYFIKFYYFTHSFKTFFVKCWQPYLLQRTFHNWGKTLPIVHRHSEQSTDSFHQLKVEKIGWTFV